MHLLTAVIYPIEASDGFSPVQSEVWMERDRVGLGPYFDRLSHCGKWDLYSVRGLERSELGGSHG